MYPQEIVQPMRDELTEVGFKEMRTPTEVEKEFTNIKGTHFVVINSVCGCAAGAARPAIIHALKNDPRPARLTTVFAGNDREATNKVRSYLVGYPPSSPAMALFKDGELLLMVERHQIEGRSAEQIAEVLTTAFEMYCKN